MAGGFNVWWRNKSNFVLRCIFCLARFPWIMLCAPFTRARREFVKQLSTLLGWAYPRPRAIVSKCPIASVWPPDGACRVLEPVQADGNVSLIELLCINGLVRKKQPLRLFEIGTFDGRTSLNMIANAPEGAKLWTLDLPPQKINSTVYSLNEGEKSFVNKAGSGARFQDSSCGERIIQLYADSAKYNPGTLISTMDLVFVDGSHTYNYVLSDTRLAMKLLRPGGLLIWHDYDGVWPDVTNALNKLFSEDPRMVHMRSIEGTTLVFAVIDSNNGALLNEHDPFPFAQGLVKL